MLVVITMVVVAVNLPVDLGAPMMPDPVLAATVDTSYDGAGGVLWEICPTGGVDCSAHGSRRVCCGCGAAGSLAVCPGSRAFYPGDRDAGGAACCASGSCRWSVIERRHVEKKYAGLPAIYLFVQLTL